MSTVGPTIAAKASYLKRCAEAELKRGNFAKAADKYTAAINALNPSRDAAELRLLFSNRSLTFLKAGHAEDALRDAAAAIRLAPGWAKGYWRQGKALAAMGRWPDALHSFLTAKQRSPSGSTESEECEKQIITAASNLTRQQLADMLLDIMQRQQQQDAGPLQIAAATAAGSGGTTAGAAGPSSQELQVVITSAAAAAAAAVDVCASDVLAYGDSSVTISSRGNSCALWQQQQQEERREALFQIIKSDQSRIQRGGTQYNIPGCSGIISYHLTVLIRALMNSSSSSSSRILDLEFQILSARIDAKLKMWTEGQAAASAAAAALKQLVLKDPEELLVLLLDCYTALGDAYMANGSSSNMEQQQQQYEYPCRPAEAAKAYLHVLNLLPSKMTTVTVESNSIGKGLKLPPIAAATAAAWQQQLYSHINQSHYIRSRLNAAQEMLTDAEQAAVCAAAAAAAGGGGGSGQSLALMQLGLAAAPIRAQEPMLLVTLTIARIHDVFVVDSATAGSESSAAAAAAASFSPSLSLSGPQRVLLLSSIARLAGVARSAVGLTQARLLPDTAHTATSGSSSSSSSGGGGCEAAGRAASLSLTVQFGCDAAAANKFRQHCSSMATLTAAVTELQQILGLPMAAAADGAAAAAAGGTSNDPSNVIAATAAAAAAAAPHDDVDQDRHHHEDYQQQQQQQQQPLMQLDQLYMITTELRDLNVQQQQQESEQQQQLQEGAGQALEQQQQQQPVAVTSNTNMLNSTESDQDSNSQLAILPTAAAADTAVVEHDQSQLPSAVIPLPYTHYSLVRGDGRAVERPDKHPFALTRVYHDSRDLPSESDAIWYQCSDLPIRWRQTASEIQIQLLNIPNSVTSAKELKVIFEPYNITVSNTVTKEIYLEGELARGVIPEDCTWILTNSTSAAAGSSRPSTSCTAAADQQSSGTQLIAAAAAGPLLPAAAAVAGGPVYGEGRLILHLTKMNLELYERPWQHSASWWPQLFADDTDQIAWDDESKDYSDLPAAVAAAHDEAAAAEEQQRQVEAERRKIRSRLQGLLDRHKRVRQERLRELKAHAYRRLDNSSSSMISSSAVTAAA